MSFRIGVRMMSTAVHTITNANNVPMFVRCSRASIGRNAVSRETKTPMTGSCSSTASNVGGTSRKCLGHQAVAGHGQKTRGALSIMTSSTEVMPATPAAAMIISAHSETACA